jgi:acyl carrier protein
MKKTDFFNALKDILEVDVNMTDGTNLRQIPEYDSMAVLSMIAFFDEKFQKKIEAEEFAKVTTISDLIGLIGADRFE